MDRPARHRHARAGADHRHVTGRRRQRLAVARRPGARPGAAAGCGRRSRSAPSPRPTCARAASSSRPRRRRSRTTSPSIPACCGSSRARSSGARLRAPPGRSCASCHGEPSSMKGVGDALSGLRPQAWQRLLNLEGRIQHCRAERQKADALRLRVAAAAGADRARRAPVAGAADERARRRAGAAVLRGGPRALPRAAGPARSLLRAMPRGQAGASGCGPSASARATPTAFPSIAWSGRRWARCTAACAPASRACAPSPPPPARPELAGAGALPRLARAGPADRDAGRAAVGRWNLPRYLMQYEVGCRFSAMSKKRRAIDNRYVWRDAETGRLVGVAIADPVVKPRTVTVEKIRKAVRDVVAHRRPVRSRNKRSA